MKKQLQPLYDYNRWANDLFAEVLDKGEYKHKKIDLFFSHIAAAQMTWLSRITEVDKKVPGVFELMPHEETCELLNYSNQRYIELIDECQDFDQLVHYTTTTGEPFSNRLADLLTHVANHGTHHRGQIALLLREEGIAPPASDYIFYLRA